MIASGSRGSPAASPWHRPAARSRVSDAHCHHLRPWLLIAAQSFAVARGLRLATTVTGSVSQALAPLRRRLALCTSSPRALRELADAGRDRRRLPALAESGRAVVAVMRIEGTAPCGLTLREIAQIARAWRTGACASGRGDRP